jgi:hypothetical protein
MSRKFSRVFFVLVLLATWLIGGIAVSGPMHGAAESGDFSAASKVLSQSGTPGDYYVYWDTPQLPVKCSYPVDKTQFATMDMVSVYANPADGFANQMVKFTTSVQRRLPDGTLKLIHSIDSWGTATSNTPAKSTLGTFTGLDLGSRYVQTVKVTWFAANLESGHVDVLMSNYQTTYSGSKYAVKDACYPAVPASASLGTTAGIVGAVVPFSIARFPSDPNVGIYFDGVKIGNVATDVHGNATGSFVVPAAPMGTHTVKFYRYGRSASVPFTIKPRIKVIPSSNVSRGSTVNISLRGYAAHETVAIRWIKNGSFVKIAQVTTSSTGSANINVTVPKWVPDGFTSVRGDGSFGHAQTNAVTVAGGPFSSASVKPASTATPTETAILSPSPTTVPETATPQPTTTVQPTEPAVTETAVPTEAPATETAIAQPTETATPTIDPTEEQASPTETPTSEPTVDQTGTVTP